MQNRNSMNILTREYLTGAPIPLDLQLIWGSTKFGMQVEIRTSHDLKILRMKMQNFRWKMICFLWFCFRSLTCCQFKRNIFTPFKHFIVVVLKWRIGSLFFEFWNFHGNLASTNSIIYRLVLNFCSWVMVKFSNNWGTTWQPSREFYWIIGYILILDIHGKLVITGIAKASKIINSY